MNIITTTAPTVQPVTLAEVYEHLRLTPEDSPPTHPDDDMLERHIATATREAEKMARRAFVQQSVALFKHDFCKLELLRPPVISVTSVKYYDSANVLQTVDPASYFLTSDLVPRVQFVEAFAYPATYRRSDAVRVDYVVGYAPTDSPVDADALRANVPSYFKDAVLLGVELLYDALSPDQREQLERAREALISGDRIPLTV